MTTKIAPPLQIPIVRGSPSHYRYEEDMWSTGPGWLSNRIREILKANGPKFTELSEPSAFGKIFIRRDKKEKKTFYPVHYMISSPAGKLLIAYRTKKAALKALSLGVGRWAPFYLSGKFPILDEMRGIVQLPIGSYIWKIDPSNNDFEDYKEHMKYPIATRRCAECPNKNSLRGICGCSMFCNILEGGRAYAWTPPHEARHRLKRDLKPKPPKMDEASLLIYNIRLKSKK